MANFIINLAGVIASVAVPFSELAKEYKGATTSFSIGIGGSTTTDPNTGGSIPHVAFWDINGNRIGQYKGNANGHINQNTEWDMSIENSQTEPQGTAMQPEYISVVMEENDAICISYIYATGNGAQWAWYGDIGYTCGADWYPSSFKVGDGTYTPKCVWIDHDYSNGLRFQGLSLHMPDFASTTDRVEEYNNDQDTLCKSSPRMKFWTSIVPDAIVPFFNPPLVYTDGGADSNPSRVIDKQKRSSIASSRPFKRDNGNFKPGHLVISNIQTHSAKEVCESETSIGPDFVSTVEGIFCDTEVKEWWYLCSGSITTGCFNLHTQSMVGNANATGHDAIGVHHNATGVINVHHHNATSVHHNSVHSREVDGSTGRVVPAKSYKTSETWD